MRTGHVRRDALRGGTHLVPLHAPLVFESLSHQRQALGLVELRLRFQVLRQLDLKRLALGLQGSTTSSRPGITHKHKLQPDPAQAMATSPCSTIDCFANISMHVVHRFRYN